MELNETRINNHQQHLESLVMLEGGIEEINDKISKYLSNDGRLNLTTKIDGSPALFIYHTFPGYPDNGICLKSFTNGPQNCMNSAEQIQAKYGDRPDMAEKLLWGLQLAPYIPDNECWQGDCLFTQSDLEEREILGTEYITFQPNKIIYAFEENSPEYDKVKNAKFGIAFHTIYTKDEDQIHQSFHVDDSRLDVSDNFYLLSPNIVGESVNDNRSEIEPLYNELIRLEGDIVRDPNYNELINNSLFMNYWAMFENNMLADNKVTKLKADSLIDDLKNYIFAKRTKEYDKKMAGLKTDKGRASATAAYNSDVEQLTNLIEQHKDLLVKLCNIFNKVVDIKMLMLDNELGRLNNNYKSFYKSKTKGYLNADPEGIAQSDMEGNIVKLVDRSTFSAFNRDDDYESGWEHRTRESYERPILKEELLKEAEEHGIKQEILEALFKYLSC